MNCVTGVKGHLVNFLPCVFLSCTRKKNELFHFNKPQSNIHQINIIWSVHFHQLHPPTLPSKHLKFSAENGEKNTVFFITCISAFQLCKNNNNTKNSCCSQSPSGLRAEGGEVEVQGCSWTSSIYFATIKSTIVSSDLFTVDTRVQCHHHTIRQTIVPPTQPARSKFSPEKNFSIDAENSNVMWITKMLICFVLLWEARSSG